MLCIALGCTVLSGCGGSAGATGTFTPRQDGVLSVATAEVPSAGFWEGTAEQPTGGFEYELAVALANRFGIDRVRIVIVPFQRIVQGDLGGADIGLDLITPTEERDQRLDFSTPYFNAPPVILTTAATSVDDLDAARALRWAVVDGTTLQELLADEIAPDQPAEPVQTNAEMVQAIESGRVEAGLIDAPLGFAYADRSDGALQLSAKLPKPEEIAVALPNDSDNTESVDTAIRALSADGTITDLADRWLGAASATTAASVPLLRTTR